VGGQLHAPAALPPGKRPGTHCIGGWLGPRAGLDGCGKSRAHRDSIPGPSKVPVLSRAVKKQFMGHPVREQLSTWPETISGVSRARMCNGIVGSARPVCRDSDGDGDMAAEEFCYTICVFAKD
jgi:hypothetical protein